jgi:hypothetical protein
VLLDPVVTVIGMMTLLRYDIAPLRAAVCVGKLAPRLRISADRVPVKLLS